MCAVALAATAAAAASAFQLGLLGGTPPSLADPGRCTITWDGGDATGDWGTAANWDATPDRVPQTDDHVCIPSGQTVEHSDGDDATILSLQSDGTLTLTGGTLTLTSAADTSYVENLTQSSGTVAGAGTLVVSNNFDWSAGVHTGTGTTRLETNATIHGQVHVYDSRLLQNQGLLTWESGTIWLGNSTDPVTPSRIENTSTGSFIATGDDLMGSTAPWEVMPAFHNAGGVVEKNTGTGTTRLSIELDNDGSLSALSGTLELEGADSDETEEGSFVAASGATLAFTSNGVLGDHKLGASSTVSGPGTVRVSGDTVSFGGSYAVAGTTEITGGTASFEGSASTEILNQSGSGVVAGPGTLTVSGGTWSGGYQLETGTTKVKAGKTFTIDGTVGLAERTLVVEATGILDWVSGDIFGGQGAVIENAGEFLAKGNGVLWGENFGGARLLLHNTGTFKKMLGTGLTQVFAALDNDGLTSVVAPSGTLMLFGGSGTESCPEGTCPLESTGAYVAEASTTISFGGGTHKITGPVSGLGTVGLDGAEVSFEGVDGAYDVDGTTALTGGTASFESASSTGTLNQSNGVFAGSGTFTVGGGTWTSGYQQGSGSTVVPSGATLTVGVAGQAVYLRGGRTLTTAVDGTVDWAEGEIYGGEGAQIENAGDFLIHGSDGGLHGEIFGGPRLLVHNTGTFRKETGTGTTTVYAAVDNDAPTSVTAASGTLVLAGGSGTEPCPGDPDSTCPLESVGAYVAGSGATLSFAGGVHKITGPASGLGTVEVAGGEVGFEGAYDVLGTTELTGGTAGFEATSSTATLNQSGGAVLSGSGTLTVGGGAWTGGSQQGAGSTVVKSGATLTVGVAGQPFAAVVLRGGRTLATAVGGTVDWLDGDIYGGEGARIENAGDFLIHGDGILYGEVFGEPRLLVHNTGTFKKETATGTTTVYAAVDNDGSLTSASGIVSLQGGDAGNEETGDFGGTAADTFVAFDAGTFKLVDGARITGRAALGNATLEVAGVVPVTAPVGSIRQSGGVVAGTGTLNVFGAYVWTGGSQQDGGSTVVKSGATLTVGVAGQPFAAVVLRGGRTLATAVGGTVDWVDGDIYGGEGARIENAGDFLIHGNGSLYGEIFGLPRLLVHNTGTFKKETATGTTTVHAAVDNDGSLTAASGTVSLQGGDAGNEETGDFGGTAPGTVVSFDAGTFTLVDGAKVTGRAGLTGGTNLNVAGTVPVTAAGSFAQADGFLGGTGTLNVFGPYVWTGGYQQDAGSTVVQSGATLTVGVAGQPFVPVALRGGRTLATAVGGTVDWVDGDIYGGEGARIENAGGFLIHGDGSLYGEIFGLPRLLVHNTGTFKKETATGTTTVYAAVDNDGSLTAASGIVSLQGGDAGNEETGDFGGTAPGTVVSFDAGTFTLVDGAKVTGRAGLTGGTNLNVAGTVPVTAAGSFAQADGFLGGTGTLNVFGAYVWTGGYQQDAGSTVVQPGATMTVGVAGQPFTPVALRDGRTLATAVGGTVDWVEGQIWGGTGAVVENAGTFRVTGDGDWFFVFGGSEADRPTVHNTGTFEKTVGADGESSDLYVRFTNDGTINAADGRLGIYDLTNFSPATKQLTGGTYVVSAHLAWEGADIETNAATIELRGPDSKITPGPDTSALANLHTNAAAGTLKLRNGRSLAVPGDFTNDGLLSLASDTTFSSPTAFAGAGTVEGTGTVAGAAVTNGGTFSAGFSPGILHVDGPYAQAAGGHLDVEVAGLLPGTGFDQLEVTGAATLGGTLDISTIAPFAPALGDTFTILTAASVAGTFDSVTGTALPGGLQYIVEYGADYVRLAVATNSISIGDAPPVTEGGNATFDVTLANAPTEDVTVHYATSDGTAKAPDDYTATFGDLTFTVGGPTTKTITVPTSDDLLDELDSESFNVTLSNPAGAAIADGVATGTINDNDDPPELSISAPDTITEGDTGTTPAQFTVSLLAESGQTVTVDAATSPGEATSDVDYVHTTDTLTFVPGETTKTFNVPIIGDVLVEGNETFDVFLANPSNATIPIGAEAATGTIEDDDTGGANLSIFKSDSPDPVALGGQLTYSISVFNEGPAAATDVEVTDDLPDGVTLVSATPSGGGTCNSTDPVVCSWLTIDPFVDETVTIVVTAPSTPTTLSNTAVVSSPDDPDTENNSSTEQTQVDELADLHLEKTATPDAGVVGEPLTYTLTVTNNGPSAASNTVLTDELPGSYEPSDVTTSQGTCGEPAGVVTCDLGTIPSGGSVVVTIEGTPTAGGTLDNLASVDADELDPQPGDNEAEVLTDVRWRHDLAVTKSDSADPISVGDEVTYTISVENVGALPLTGVVATDTLPAGLIFVSSPTCTAAGQVVTCAVGDLAPDEIKTATFVAEATTAFTKINTVTVTAAEGDDFTDNNTATQETRVRDSALEIARAMIEDESWLTGASFATVPPQGNPNMVGRSPFAGFPRHGDTFAVLTSGDAELADDPNTSPSSGVDIGGENVRGNTDFDVTILKVDLDVPSGYNCLSVNFRFGSDEYPEFKGTQFNDAFIAELDTSTWTTNGSVITSPANFAFDPANNAITINAAGFTSMTEANAAGTTYDGATPLLSASQAITPGAHSLYLSIFDQGDGIYDSAVLLDRLRLAAVAPGACTPGATILTATKTADAARSEAGTANGYTISIANPHTEPFEIDEITDDLPAGFTYTPGSTSGATTADPTIAGGRLTWTGPFTLPAGGALTLHFGVTVATAPGDYFNDAAAVSDDVSITPTGPTAKITVLPELTVGDATVTEGDAGTKDATFTVNLSGASDEEVTVDYVTEDGTATGAFADADPGSGFVGRAGSQLFLDDVPYRFGGLNVYNANSDGLCWYSYDAGQLDASLASIGNLGGKSALRSWFFQDLATTGGVRDWTAIDRTLDRARANGFKVIATLGNHWADCDNGYGRKDPDWYSAGYQTVDPAGTVSYRAWVAEIVDRYKDDPAILMWEPVNEPETSGLDGSCGPGAAANLQAFTGDVAGLIKSIDSNHLISTGVIGSGQCGASGPEYEALHALAAVDVCSFHDYSAVMPMPGDAFNGLQLRLAQCAGLNKPLIVGEAGIIPNDVGGSFGARAAAFHAKLLRQIPAGVAGYLPWAWNRDGSTLDIYDIGPGDPVLGTLAAFGDYESAAGTVTFAPGETTKTVTVKVIGDTLDEPNETYRLKLHDPVGASLLDGTGDGTIVDDDDPPALSIGDVSVTEGDAGTKTASFQVTLSAASGQTITTNFGTSSGTATEGVDFEDATGALTFEPGQTTKTIAVTINGDTVFEANETYHVNLTAPTNASIADGTGLGTIVNDDAAPTLAIDDVSKAEGNSGTTAFTFTVTKTGATELPVSIDFATADGLATQPGDYASASGTLNFAAGEASKTITALVKGDLTFEANETFFVNLSNVSGATVADGQGVGTIENDDAAPTFSVDNVSQAEGNSGTTEITFTVTKTGATELASSVDFATANGTATQPGDYASASGTLNFAPGETSKTLTVLVNGDLTFETNENFLVHLSNAVGATIADDLGLGTIVNDDGAPAFSIDDVSKAEGDSGTTAFTFTVTKTGATELPASVDFATANGTATQPVDYQSASGSLSFAAGEASKTITVLVNGDLTFEANQTFFVNLSNASGATIADDQGLGTIENDDAAPTFSIDNVSQAEGNSGTTAFTFTVTKTGATELPSSVDFATANGTATQPGDYASTTGTRTFGAAETSKTITVLVNGDTIFEANETFFVNLSNPSGATISDDQGLGTIVSDDAAPTFSVDNVSQAEGNSGTTAFTFTVTKTGGTELPSSVDFATANGSATQPVDYVSAGGTLSFAPGESSKTTTVLVNGDLTFEANETFFVNLSNPSGATIADEQGQGTIVNDDPEPTLAIDNVSQAEGNSGTTAFVFTVTKTGATELPASVDFATEDLDATAPGDYVSTSGTLDFAPGETSKAITVLVNGEVVFEEDEGFWVLLLSSSGATIGEDDRGVGTIENDDAAPTLAIDDVIRAEGDSGTTAFTFTVTKTGATALAASVDFATANGTATAPGDYASGNGTLTFAPGESSKQVTVLVNGDLVFEANETFFVNLTNASGATIADNQGVGTIENDDAAPSLAIDNVSKAEGNSGTTAFTFTVTKTGATQLPASVDFATADGTATQPGDYQPAGGTLNFAAGETSKTITVLVNGDATAESDETFHVNLTNATNATIADDQGLGTIENDDAGSTLAISDVTALEGDFGTTAFVFTVTKSETGNPASVDFATANGTATAPGDYSASSGTLSFAADETTKTITVLVNGDVVFEANESFFVNLSNASGATIADGQGVGTIENDDAAPSLAIDNVSKAEGNSGTTAFTFTVTKTGATELPASIDFATANGTATAPSDYAASSGTLSFAAGEATKQVTVLVNGDNVFEGVESFLVHLSNPSGATIADGQGVGAIENDDAAPTFAIDNVSRAEGNFGTTAFTFTVTKTGATELPASVNFASANGTATQPGDYASTSGSLSFAPGETSKTTTVLVNGDLTFEANETFFVDLSNATGATIADGQGVGTIENDDAAPSLAIDNVSKAEGNSGTTAFTFTVTKTGATELPASIDFATADGLATQPGDYASAGGTLSFAPGETSKTVTVLVNGDLTFEANESFFVNLTNVSGASVADGQGAGTIENDDVAPSFSVDNVSKVEGNGGTTAFVFTVTKAGATELPASVDFATANGTATQPGDYQQAGGTLSFAPGETNKTVTVLVNGDTTFEANETFFVNLSNATGATIADDQGGGTIVNDDAAPTFSVDDVSRAEGNSGTTAFTFTVTKAGATELPASVDFATADGTATQPSDYSSAGGTLSFAPGETSKAITALVNGDTTIEPDETFTVELSNPTGATLADAQGVGTILNDDANAAPDAVDDSATTDEDTPVEVDVLANDTDAEGDTLTISGFGQGARGTVTLVAGNKLRYAPDANVNGSDTFTYTISDGHGGSDTATVTIVVTAVNDAPVNTVPAAQATAEDTPLTFSTAAGNRVATSDVDAGADAVQVSLGVAHGTVTLSGTTGLTFSSGSNGSAAMTFSGTLGAINAALNGLVYASAGNYNGPDTLSMTTSDLGHNPGPTVLTDTDSVAITVSAVNDAPVATDDDVSGTEDTDVVMTKASLLANDTDVESTLSLTAVANAHGGTVEISGANVIFHPALNLCGPDVAGFDYTVSDGSLTDTGTVTIDLTCVNDAPVAVDDSATTREGAAVDVNVLANDLDVDGDTLGVASFTQGTNGTVAVVGGKLRYGPNAGFSGTDTFTYRANDGSVDSNLATVTITVTPNAPPVAADDTATTPEDTAVDVDVLANDTDADGDPRTITSFTQPAHGVVTENPNHTLRYAPAANSNGTDSFTYTISDGHGGIDTATVTITVTPVNDAPAAANNAYTVDEDATLSVAAPGVLGNDTDVEGSALSAILVAGPAHGTLTLNANGSFTYTPNANFNGADSFTYKANDGALDSNVATVAITVNPVNDAPVAANDAYAVDAGATLSVAAPGVLANDGDVDGNALSAVLGTGPAHGTLTLNANGSFTYTPAAGYSGPDSFTYRARDGALDSNVATVSLDVRGGGTPPAPGTPCTITGTPQADVLTGGPGNDVICALGGNDTVDGAGGNDYIDAGPGNDRVAGGLGNDHIRGQVGDDVLGGGDGNDEIEAGNGDDEVRGGAGADDLSGASGKDVLAGDEGDDLLAGDAGEDVLEPGSGNDRVDGGTSDDTIRFSNAGAGLTFGISAAAAVGVTVDLTGGTATGEGTDTLIALENAVGSPLDDRITGSARANRLEGGDGDDRLFGLAGNDLLLGGPGDDFLRGGGGFNVLDGAAGTDDCANDGGSGQIVNCEGKTVAGAPLVPVGSFTSSLAEPGQTVTKTFSVPGSTPGVGVTLIWNDPAASFGVSVELLSGNQVVARGLASAGKLRLGKPTKLRLKTRKGATFLSVEAQTPAKLRLSKKPLKLRLKVRAKKVTGKTTVTTRVLRQRPKR